MKKCASGLFIVFLFFCRADNKQYSSFSEPKNSVSDIEVAEVAYNAED